MRLLITELVTLTGVLSFGIMILKKLGRMYRHFNARLDGLARGIAAVQEIATGLLPRAAAVHERRDSRVDPSGSSAPPSALRHD